MAFIYSTIMHRIPASRQALHGDPVDEEEQDAWRLGQYHPISPYLQAVWASVCSTHIPRPSSPVSSHPFPHSTGHHRTRADSAIDDGCVAPVCRISVETALAMLWGVWVEVPEWVDPELSGEVRGSTEGQEPLLIAEGGASNTKQM